MKVLTESRRARDFFFRRICNKIVRFSRNADVAWVLAYDSDRVAQNSAAVLNQPVPLRPLCRVLYQTPSQAPPFLIFSAQNPTCKLYRVAVER